MLLTGLLKQTAVYWPPTGGHDGFGRPIRGDPEEIDCRWEDVAEEFVTPDGERAVSRSKVFVGQDLEVGGMLFLGEIDSTGFPDPIAVGAFEIRSFQKTPTVKADRYVRLALL